MTAEHGALPQEIVGNRVCDPSTVRRMNDYVRCNADFGTYQELLDLAVAA